MMTPLRLVLVLLLALLLDADGARAQHCAPIVESYLSAANITHTRQGIAFRLQYSKTGGQPKPAYQAYWLAYRDSSSKKLSEATPQQAIANKLVTIVHTQLAERSDSGVYEMVWELETKEFVEAMLMANQLSVSRTNDAGGWKSFSDEIRIAVFIPFLEDEQYSTLGGLPEDRHECNYRADAALLFETIPARLTVAFGIVQAVRLTEGEYHIELNGKRPAGQAHRKPRR